MPEGGASRARWRYPTRRPQCGTRRRPTPKGTSEAKVALRETRACSVLIAASVPLAERHTRDTNGADRVLAEVEIAIGGDAAAAVAIDGNWRVDRAARRRSAAQGRVRASSALEWISDLDAGGRLGAPGRHEEDERSVTAETRCRPAVGNLRHADVCRKRAPVACIRVAIAGRGKAEFAGAPIASASASMGTLGSDARPRPKTRATTALVAPKRTEPTAPTRGSTETLGPSTPSALSASDGSPQPPIARQHTPTANVETLGENALNIAAIVTHRGPATAPAQVPAAGR